MFLFCEIAREAEFGVQRTHLVRASLFRRLDPVVPPVDLRMRDDESATAVAGPLVHEGAQRVRFILGGGGQRVGLFVKFPPILGRAQYVRRHHPIHFHPVGPERRLLSYPAAVKPPRVNPLHPDRRNLDLAMVNGQFDALFYRDQA